MRPVPGRAALSFFDPGFRQSVRRRLNRRAGEQLRPACAAVGAPLLGLHLAAGPDVGLDAGRGLPGDGQVVEAVGFAQPRTGQSGRYGEAVGRIL